uniref:Cytochrome C oxidase subunit II n=1 Tax=Archaeoglobus fulgidus TaxID=2234 RepID=A0A7J3M2V1_ARCFL
MKKVNPALIAVVLSVIAIVISLIAMFAYSVPYGYMPMMGYGMGYMKGYWDWRQYPPGCCQGPVSFSSNGERIYFTGVNSKGERIPFTGGPSWLIMHGGSCINCHGRDGRGGFIPMMCSKVSADIRYSELVKEGMSEKDIKSVITKGEYDDETLDWCMPRWHMSEEDLNDIIVYLQKLR